MVAGIRFDEAIPNFKNRADQTWAMFNETRPGASLEPKSGRSSSLAV